MTTAIINPAILDVHAFMQSATSTEDKKTIEDLFASTLNAKYDFTMQSSSVEEFKEFYFKVYAKDSVERIASRVDEDTMIFKVETIENYGQEDFVAKTFYQLRKNGDNYFFNELSVSFCIHTRGFIPVTIARTEEDEFKVKFHNDAYGEDMRITKTDEGRDFIRTSGRHSIFTDM